MSEFFGIVKKNAKPPKGARPEWSWRNKNFGTITFLKEDVQIWLDVFCNNLLDELASLGHAFTALEIAKFRADSYSRMIQRCEQMNIQVERITPCPVREWLLLLLLCKDLGCLLENDSNKTAEGIEDVLTENPKLVKDFLAGKTVVINALIGKCMAKIGKGKIDPTSLKPLLEQRLAGLTAGRSAK